MKQVRKSKKTKAHSAKEHRVSQKVLAAIFAGVFAIFGIAFLLATRAAGTATLVLTPSTQTLALGENITLSIVENSGTVTANAVQADLVYDKTKLEYVSTSTTNSPFSLVAQNTGGNGTTSLAAATTNPVTGQQTVATVTFKAIATGTTSVTYATSSSIVSSTTDILGTTTGATVTINDTAAPSVPSALTVGTRTVNSVAFSWAASTDNVGVTGYRIFRNGTQIGTSTATNFTATNLAVNTAYSFTVAAVDAANNVSGQSAALATSTLPDTAAPSVPSALTVGTRTVNSVAFSWAASTDNVGVTGYRIFRNGTQIGTSTATNFTATNLAVNTAYSFTVAAVDAANNVSAQSAALATSTLPDTTAPSVPTGLTSPTQTTSTIALAWNASTDNVAVTGYRVFRNGVLINTATGTSFTDSGPTQGATYSYAVVAYDAAGNTSGQSTSLQVKTVVKQGDANGDNQVNISDLSIMATTWLSTTDLRADFNKDGVVNVFDLALLSSNWGK